MNVLLITVTVGDTDQDRLAVVPIEELEGYDLNAINGKEVQSDDITDQEANQICMLYDRLGLCPFDGGELDENWNEIEDNILEKKGRTEQS